MLIIHLLFEDVYYLSTYVFINQKNIQNKKQNKCELQFSSHLCLYTRVNLMFYKFYLLLLWYSIFLLIANIKIVFSYVMFTFLLRILTGKLRVEIHLHQSILIWFTIYYRGYWRKKERAQFIQVKKTYFYGESLFYIRESVSFLKNRIIENRNICIFT